MRLRHHHTIVVSACLLLSVAVGGGCGNKQTPSEPAHPRPTDAAGPGVPDPGVPGEPPANASPSSPTQATPQSVEPIAEPSATDSSPPPDPATLHNQAMLALQAGQDDQAFQLARQAMRLAPEDPQVVFLMAMVLGNRKRYPEAIAMLDELATTTAEVRLPVLGQTAEWMVRFGQYSQAEKRYRRLLEQVPDAVMVHRNLSQLMLRQGRRIEAAEHLITLCSLGDIREDELRSLLSIAHPFPGDAAEDSFDPIGMLGRARVDVSRDQWASVRSRLEASPVRSAEADALLGRAYAQLNDGEALDAWIDRSWIDRSGESVDRYPDAWLARGVWAALHGDHAAAVGSLAECVLRDQTDHQAYALMSQSLRALGAVDEAEATSRRAETIRKTDTIGAAMAAEETRDAAALAQLAELLQQLRRPLEALAWRGVQLAYAGEAGAIATADAQRRFNEIAQQRRQSLQADRGQASRQFVLCGVDLDALD
ncbi:tetratricopeptide repeat protein [Stieleria neptunia]|uniref:tetratricopeptide repeat protein n=1 Tax=Stieleria neptunia TaxID=2527979 RepID=UPI0011AA8A26|nr:tetratricopeptide repeat protein [Stieleria neptunia]